MCGVCSAIESKWECLTRKATKETKGTQAFLVGFPRIEDFIKQPRQSLGLGNGALVQKTQKWQSRHRRCQLGYHGIRRVPQPFDTIWQNLQRLRECPGPGVGNERKGVPKKDGSFQFLFPAEHQRGEQGGLPISSCLNNRAWW